MSLADPAGLKDALNLHHALEQTEAYLNGPPQDSTLLTEPDPSTLYPLVTTTGHRFARRFLDKSNQVVAVAKPPKPGTLITYRAHHLTQYGIVATPSQNSPSKAIAVKPITPHEASQLIAENQDLNRFSVGQKDNIVSPTLYRQIKPDRRWYNVFLDPLDRFVFKVEVILLERLTLITTQQLVSELILATCLALAATVAIWLIITR